MNINDHKAILFFLGIPIALLSIAHGFTSVPVIHTFADRSQERVIGQKILQRSYFVYSQIEVNRYSYEMDGLAEEPELSSTFIGSKKSITQRLGLKSRFDRWKFLQSILEGEVGADDTNQIVFQILQSHLNHSSSPLDSLKQEQKSKIVDNIFRWNENGDGVVMALVHDDSGIVTVGSDKVWAVLQTLLPNPDDDEDSFKCGWDLVVEMYGREATKISQTSGDPLWKAYADIARLLIHLDFLSDGILEEPFS